MIAESERGHEAISNAMERCRNGAILHIKLSNTTVSIRCEAKDIGHQFYVFDDESEHRIEGVAVWKLISNHAVRIE